VEAVVILKLTFNYLNPFHNLCLIQISHRGVTFLLEQIP
jgi:hypothetical protein